MTDSPRPPEMEEAPLAPLPLPSFAEIFDAHFGYVWNTLRRLGVRESEAQDQTQEVFVVVSSLLGDYDPARPIRPWLFGIAYRVAARWRALARHRREVAMDAPPDPADPRPAADDALAAHEARELVLRALDTMDLERRAVFVMNLLDEQPMPAVAEALGIPLNTAYSRLRLAREDFETAVKRLRGKS